MRPNCDDLNFDQAEDFTRWLDRLKRFLMIEEIPTNHYSHDKGTRIF